MSNNYSKRLTNRRFMDKLFFVIILFFIVFKLGIYLYSYRYKFVEPFDYIYISRIYSTSQYVAGEGSKGGIGDDGLYAFSGYYYFLQKGDVSSVNFEHPPLGKYLIGLSIFLFNNQNVINLFYFFALLIIVYKISLEINPNRNLSMIPLLILSFDPLFLNHLINSMLDLPFSVFFLWAVFYFLKSFEDSKKIYFSMFFWGLAFSTRFFPAFFLIWFFLLIAKLIYQGKRQFLSFLLASFLVLLVYLFSHISFFYYHPSIIEFVRHKIWMISWFRGSPIILGNILRNIIFGQFLDSSGHLQKDEYWTELMPIIFILGIAPFKIFFSYKKNSKIFIVYNLSLLYTVYLALLTKGFLKFFMPVYPLVIILAINNLLSVYSIIFSWKKTFQN